MKKDIINLTHFLFENNTQCEKIMDGLVIHHNALKLIIGDVNNTSELVSIKVKEGSLISRQDIVTEIVPTEAVKNIIIEAWEQIEKDNNKNFISTYGEDDYQYFRKSFIDAIQGEKGNDRFTFEFKKYSDRIEINLREKSTGMTSCATLNYADNDSIRNTYGATFIKASVIVKVKNITENTIFKWKTAQFSISIPNVELEKYDLGLSSNMPYVKEEVFSYLKDQVKDEASKRILLAFELQNDLDDKNLPTKKLKI